MTVLVCSGCYNNIKYWYFTNNRNFSYCGGQTVQDQGASRFGVWLGPVSWFLDDCLLIESSHGQKANGASWSLFEKGINPNDNSSALMT